MRTRTSTDCKPPRSGSAVFGQGKRYPELDVLNVDVDGDLPLFVDRSLLSQRQNPSSKGVHARDAVVFLGITIVMLACGGCAAPYAQQREAERQQEWRAQDDRQAEAGQQREAERQHAWRAYYARQKQAPMPSGDPQTPSALQVAPVPPTARSAHKPRGEVACGSLYAGYEESDTGMVCAGGQYGSYHESNTGEVACGGEYGSYHESSTGKVCAGGQYSSYHESSTGEVACGGEYSSYHESSTGKVCAGSEYSSYHESSTGEVACGGEYSSYHESSTGKVCAGGEYSSYHESSTGEVACGGQFTGYHESRTGKVCCGGRYPSYFVGRTGEVCVGGYFDGFASSAGGSGRSANVVEASIDGDFEGWDGETTFRLSNGQVWQQVRHAGSEGSKGRCLWRKFFHSVESRKSLRTYAGPPPFLHPVRYRQLELFSDGDDKLGSRNCPLTGRCVGQKGNPIGHLIAKIYPLEEGLGNRRCLDFEVHQVDGLARRRLLNFCEEDFATPNGCFSRKVRERHQDGAVPPWCASAVHDFPSPSSSTWETGSRPLRAASALASSFSCAEIRSSTASARALMSARIVASKSLVSAVVAATAVPNSLCSEARRATW
jgi:hypothetical protein